jgi:hypothetical protein
MEKDIADDLLMLQPKPKLDSVFDYNMSSLLFDMLPFEDVVLKLPRLNRHFMDVYNGL